VVQCKCKVLPGIDIGIPAGKNSRKASPDETYAAAAAALKAGADGLILSRKYSEMELANLSSAGRAVRDAVKAWSGQKSPSPFSRTKRLPSLGAPPSNGIDKDI
jgi:hypothetical protein